MGFVVRVDEPIVDEAAGELRFTLTLDRPSDGSVRGQFQTLDGSARAGEDYVAVVGEVAFHAGETRRTITVPLIDDAVVEPDERFALALFGFVDARVGVDRVEATIAASDWPAVAQPWLRVDDRLAAESSGSAEFVVRLQAPAAVPVVLDHVRADGLTAGAPGEAGQVTLAPGQTVAHFRLAWSDDARPGPPQDLPVHLSVSPAGAARLATSQARVTVIDDDGPPGVPVVSLGSPIVDEGAGEIRFAVRLDRPATDEVSLSFAVRAGSASPGEDFLPATGSLRFGPGEVLRTVRVALLDDTLAESDEDLSLVVTDVLGALAPEPAGRAVIVANDAPARAQPGLRIDDGVVDESAGFADLVLRLDGPTPEPVSVTWASAPASALAGIDYRGAGGVVTFVPGETSRVLRVAIHDDAQGERAESLTVRLTSTQGAVSWDDSARITVVDNDAPAGTPALTVSDGWVDEVDRQARFVLRLDRPAEQWVSVDYLTVDGQANAGRDFTPTLGRLVFLPGQTVRTVSVDLVDDSAEEPDEAFGLALARVTGALVSDPVGVVTIAASDAPARARPALAVADVRVPESLDEAAIVVRLAAPVRDAVVVGVTLVGDTAALGADVLPPAGTLVFAPGETIETVPLDLIDDPLVEATESARLTLAGAGGAAGSARIEILDDDGVRVLPGSAGPDVFVIDRPDTRIDEPPDGGIDQAVAWVSWTLPAAIEHLRLEGEAPLNAAGNAGANTLQGNAGANTLVGGAGDDRLEGGPGLDSAVFPGPRSDYRVGWLPGSWRVEALRGDAGHDTLTGVEILVFDDAVLPLLAPPADRTPSRSTHASFLFDPVYYRLAHSAAVPVDALDALAGHYLSGGAARGLRPSAWFDAAWYGQRWDDLRALALDEATLFQHWNLHGVWEGRVADPRLARFDAPRYLRDHPAAAAFVSERLEDFLGSPTNGALGHLLTTGLTQGLAAFDTDGAPIAPGYLL